ncbi:MAG: hypothetical protein JXA73_24850 [Acidobacteria bacterium]|nr:hypothetical protein [Acidobacteriota bacterium]
MITGIKQSWSAIFVIGAALLIGSLSSAAWSTQAPERAPTSESERKRMMDRLSKRTQEAQQAPAASSEAVSQQAQPPVPAPAAVPTPPAPAIPPAAASVPRDSGKVQLSYENADLYDFINQISTTLGISPLIVDSEVKGSVNIINTGPMSKEEILPLFNLILKNNNAALVRQDNVYQIVPISSALKKGVDIIEVPVPTPEEKAEPEGAKPKASGPAAPAGPSKPAASKTPVPSQGAQRMPSESSRLATHVIRAEFVPVKDLIDPVKLFMTDGGVIMPYERLNMLIITDYTDSAARVLDIIHMLDNNYLDPDLVDLIKIKYNAATDVAEDLKKIFGAGTKDSATGISFVPIDRLNALFVIASSKRGLEELKKWISILDAESGRNIQTYVYVVENSTASSIAMMLSALYGGDGSSSSVTGGTGTTGGDGAAFSGGRSTQTGASGRSGTSSRDFQSGSVSGAYNQGSNQGYGSYGGFQGGLMGGAFGTGQRLGPQLNVSRTITSQILQGGEFTGLQDTVRLVVDDINNSLIIQATAVDYAYILDTIRKMDVLPRQVLIDARIFSVDLTNDLSYGVNAFLQRRGDTSKGETLTTGSLQSGQLSANTFAFIGDSRQILLQLDALRSKTKVKILEAPSVLALDGMQASINVGSEYPYPSGSYTSSAGGSTTNVGYRETGVTLLVLPRISASGSVTLDITQEVSSPGGTVPLGEGGDAPSFKKSLVSTSFYVKDGETVAIAGLIHDSDDRGRIGIPFLSEIPILGSLFGRTSKNTTRSELIILITPHVMKTHEKLQEVTQDLKDSLRNVRKFMDQKEKDKLEDLQDARKDREKEERKRLEEQPSSQPEK